MNILRKNSFTTAKWSGGTTTELRIVPEGASYSERQFDFRVSTATVEAGESRFTLLEGVERHLMVLEGKIILRHDDMKDILLNPFEQNNFDGASHTVSLSQDNVVDFNLMLKGFYKGRLIHHDCKEQLLIEGVNIVSQHGYYREFYCVNGRVELAIGNHSMRLFAGDYLQLQQKEIFEAIQVEGSGNLIEIQVWNSQF